MVDKKFGAAGDTLVLEEFLNGTETSMLCFSDGNKLIPMASSKDYKKIFDNDEGPNTGGMGTFSPNPTIDVKLNEKINKKILDPILKGFKQEKLNYKGILYVGLMIVQGEPKVLEFNVRFGDPETQVLMLRLESDLVKIMLNATDGLLDDHDVVWKDNAAVCVVLASGGYPGSYQKGKMIRGLEPLECNAVVFHAGTKKTDEG
jgi:phosphoribosylamine--glycine ligase